MYAVGFRKTNYSHHSRFVWDVPTWALAERIAARVMELKLAEAAFPCANRQCEPISLENTPESVPEERGEFHAVLAGNDGEPWVFIDGIPTLKLCDEIVVEAARLMGARRGWSARADLKLIPRVPGDIDTEMV